MIADCNLPIYQYTRTTNFNEEQKVLCPAVKRIQIDGKATEILDMGCKGFVYKPFRVEKLSQKIRTALDCRHS